MALKKFKTYIGEHNILYLPQIVTVPNNHEKCTFKWCSTESKQLPKPYRLKQCNDTCLNIYPCTNWYV